MNTDWTQIIVTGITVLVSSGIIQFFVTRKDKKEEEKKKNDFEILRKEFKDGLEQREKASVDRFDILHKEIVEGLEDREKTGKMRYDEHHISIEKSNLQHQKDFQALLESIKKLESNDTKITEGLQQIADKQQSIGDGIMGLSHDKLIYMTDKISERGGITLKEKATLKSIFNPYRALGGNGDCAEGMLHIESLKVVTEEEAKKLDKEIEGIKYSK